MTDKGCSGAPDMVIEIVSACNSSHDYITKLMQYQKSGVREYWIVNLPRIRKLQRTHRLFWIIFAAIVRSISITCKSISS